MKTSASDLVLHPVRIKVLQVLALGKPLTVQQINQQLPQIAQATLYRHLNKLVKGGMIQAVEEKQVRGTVEKTYALSSGSMLPEQQDIMSASPEEHLNMFLKFIGILISDFEEYIHQPDFHPSKDLGGYSQAILHMSDEEFMDFNRELQRVFLKAAKNEPSPLRQARNITFITTSKRNIDP
ncbi:helix-turn-helix domain-containing protein [Metabacillus lacus]|uniref:helix-turn-helix domain-containing protein n=1 Tax=Metabacillus lacus TaxID=1983721 RepID=UPI0012AF7D0F|nr:helix-turn-helix domain-containing protein [Metabacillus lacus]